MALYAIDDLDDAWAATREFLTPLSVTRLLVLAVVVFFVGGTGSNFSRGGGSSGTSEPTGTEPNLDAVWTVVLENALVIGLVGGTLLLLILGYMFIGALMEFVFVQSLRTDEVRFWGYSRTYLGDGLRLLGFRIALAVLTIVPVVGLIGVGLTTIGAGSLSEIGGATLLVLGLLAVVVFVLVSIVDSFTTAFVVPVMLRSRAGVLDSWRAFWPTLTGQWKQYLAYLIAALVLNIALGIVYVILVAIAVVALLIPFAIGVAGTAFLAEAILTPVAIVLGVLFVLGVILLALVAQVPIQVYLRYYALLVLGDTDDELDPVPELRRTIRAGSADPGDREPDAPDY